MKKLLTICLMLLGAVAQAQNFAITATTEAAIRKNIVKGNAANYGFGMINDTLKLVGLTTRNVIFTGSTSKTDIGLGNVDNTSDLNKPVSTATQTALNLKQNQLNGTGFVKATGTTISYDNSTYLSTSSASLTYLPINNPTATGTLTAPTIANSLGANFATTSGNVGIGIASPAYKLDVSGTARFTGAATFTGGIFSFGSGGITSNTAIGFQALNSNTTGYQNIAIGNSSLSANTTGFNNTANGVNSLSANTTGVSNSAFGLNSLLSNTSGGKNTAIGEQSLSANTTGANNTAVGYFALSNNTTSYGNSAFGYQALIVNTTGQENTSIGFQSLYSNTTGSSNTAIGQQSLYSNTTGGINTSVGLNAGRFISGGSVANTITNNSIYLGGFTKALADNQTNQIVIGHNAVGNGSNTTVLGNTSTTQTQIFGNTILSNTSQAADTGEKLQVNGTAKFVNGVNLATTSGNVGIGTASPTSKIHVIRTGVGIQDLLTLDNLNQSVGVLDGVRLNLRGFNIESSSTYGSSDNILNLGFSTSKQITLLQNGNVGIGTNAPDEKLEVFNGNYTNLKISANQQSSIKLNTTTLYGVNNPNAELYNNYGNVGLTLYPTPTATRNDIIYYDNTDKETQFQTDGSTKLRIRGNGNVLIGTPTDAGYKLDVSGTLRTVNDAYFATTSGNVGIGTTSPSQKLSVLVSTGTAIPTVGSAGGHQILSNGTYGMMFGVNNSGNGWIQASRTDATATNYNLLLNPNGGNVGIGTTSPQNLLHVKGTASVGVGVRNSHLIIESAETAAVGVGAVLKFAGQSGNAVNPYSFGTIEARKESAVANNYSSYMTFQTIESNGGSTERMRISGNGNIGIGTDAPNASSILDIASTTKGVLFPRMTTGEINLIASPADGLTVYNTTLKAICFYDSSAAVWKRVSHSNM